MSYSNGSRTTYSSRYGSNRYSAQYKKRAHNYAKKSLRRYNKRAKRRNTRVGGFLGIELKFYDTSTLLRSVLADGDLLGGEFDPVGINALNAIPQGDGESQRIGRVATIKSIHVFGHFRFPEITVSAAVEPLIYIALVQDKQTNGAQLNSEDVFVNPSLSGVLGATPMKNLQNASRFTVLQQMQLVPKPIVAVSDGVVGGIAYNTQYLPFSMTKQCNQRVIYNGTTETVSNITDHSFHIIAFTSEDNVVALQLSYNCRIRFVG